MDSSSKEEDVSNSNSEGMDSKESITTLASVPEESSASSDMKDQEKPDVEKEKSQASGEDVVFQSPDASNEKEEECVTFKAIFMNKKYTLSMPLSSTIKDLKESLSSQIDVMPSMQKIIIKGQAVENKTLKELGVNKSSKILVVGSKLDDVVSVNLGDPAQDSSSSKSSSKKTKYSEMAVHKKILAFGKPEETYPGILNCKECILPSQIHGMIDGKKEKVRLTFKLNLDQLWIGTAARTQKINMTSIRNIVYEEIPSHKEYCIMGFQLGRTEASLYWVYWMPSQFIDVIIGTVLGRKNL